MIDIKRAVSDGNTVQFTHFRDGMLWYKTQFDESFPVPIDEAGTATFNATDRAILFMRYMRKWNVESQPTEVDKLKETLYGEGGLQVSNFGFSPGSDPADAETTAKQIRMAIEQIEAGDFEVVAELDD